MLVVLDPHTAGGSSDDSRIDHHCWRIGIQFDVVPVQGQEFSWAESGGNEEVSDSVQLLCAWTSESRGSFPCNEFASKGSVLLAARAALMPG